MTRKAHIERKTRETDIDLSLSLGGEPGANVKTGIPFMDHMLELMAMHGLFEIAISARGDTQIDDHHTVEDLGICLGDAIRTALGDRRGITRYGESTLPMDETLVRVVMDLSNRPGLFYRVNLSPSRTGAFDVALVKEFFRALVAHAGMTLHVDLFFGEDPHHVAEAIFKAFGRSLDQATRLDARRKDGLPSTKGLL